MTPTEAEDLATLFRQTWPRGPETLEWETALLPLEHGRAGTAYARMKSSPRSGPATLDQFHATYGPAARPATPTHGTCTTCDNTGWIYIDETGPNGRTTTAVNPCHCGWGDDRRHIAETITTHNTRELDHLFPGRHTPPSRRPQ